MVVTQVDQVVNDMLFIMTTNGGVENFVAMYPLNEIRIMFLCCLIAGFGMGVGTAFWAWLYGKMFSALYELVTLCISRFREKRLARK